MIEILTGVLCFLNIVDTVFKIKDKVVIKEEKDGVSHFLNKIGSLLNSVADDLERGIYPHDKCSEMWSYLKGFESIVSGKMSSTDAVQLEGEIRTAFQVEKLLGDLSQLTPEAKSHNLATLRSAAGSFFAASTLIKL